MQKLNDAFLTKTIQEIGRKRGVFGAVMCVASEDGSFSWTGSVGNMQEDSQYFIASVTKLYITAIMMHLVEKKKLQLDDSIKQYLSKEIMQGLHVFKGIEYSDRITIKHLISNTSGIPDYFFHKLPNGKTFADDLLEGNDTSWTFENSIAYVKELSPKFSPGKKGRAAYSDTNYVLLGKIIEVVTGKSIHEVLTTCLFKKLNLEKTYAYQDEEDTIPTKFYYGAKELWVPKYMTCVPAEGGIVSTAKESMQFIKAFFNGEFFEKEKIEGLKAWNLILPPPSLFYYGIGLEKLFVPRIISPFKPISEIVGFWGQTGSFAWYNPDSKLFFTGTTNQINGAGHTAAMMAMLKIIKKVL